MVKLNKIYTRTGDDGTTGLVDGSRSPKHAARVHAYGTVDEANAVLGLARLHASGDDDAMLARIQNELFDLGADLATPGEIDGALRVVPAQVGRLEAEVDSMNAELEPLKSFILPGGGALAANLHHARTGVRRAERIAVAANEGEGINPHAIAYLNRLSDHLFVMARQAAAREGGDILWIPGATR